MTSIKLKNLRILYSAHLFLHYLPLGLFFPVSTLFLLDKGYSLGWIGTAMAVYSVTVTILELPTGGVADRWGRLLVYRISRIFYLISLALIIFSTSITILCLGMFFYGVSRALSSGSMDAWYVDMHEKAGDDELQKSIAFSEVVATAGLGISTLLGGLIPYLGKDMNLPFGRYSFNMLIGIAVVFLHLFLHFVVFTREQSDNSTTDAINFLDGITGIFKKSRTLQLLIAVSFALGVGLSAVEGFWQPRVRELSSDAPSIILGILASIYFFTATAGSLLSLTLIKQIGQKATLICMKSFNGIALITLGLWSSISGFSFGFAIIFIFHGVASVPHQTILHKSIPSSFRSTLLSMDSLALMTGAGIASALFGWLAQIYSITLVWGAAGTLVLLSAILYLPMETAPMEKSALKETLNEPSV